MWEVHYSQEAATYEDAPAGVQPVDWILGSQNSISCVEDALQLLSKTHGLVAGFGCHKI